MGEYKFFCTNCHKQKENKEISIELGNGKLCDDCASKGWNLKITTVAYRQFIKDDK